MSTELVKHHAAPAASLPEKMDYARALAASGMLPSQYRQQPANLLYALEYAESLGLHPMAAITGIHVIEGKPSASAALISALVRRAGHKLRVRGNDEEAVAQIVRADDPDFTFEARWTMARAEQAGLARKAVWKSYPAAMLKARAITEVARDACEEALSGMHYTPEELGANVNADGEIVDAEVQQLRRVPSGEQDPWATPAPGGEFVPHPEAQALAVRASEAKSRDELTAIADEAKDSVPSDARIKAPDTGEQDGLREYLARRWKALPKPEEKQDDNEVTDAVVVAEGETEADIAERELRAAAAKAGLTNLDEEFERSYGLPIKEASAQQLREMTGLLTGTAA